MYRQGPERVESSRVSPVRRALISDIHGNLEALEAVLEHIGAQSIEEIYCLGDIVGYGPNPRECIDRVRRCAVCLLGNHDQGALFDPEGFNAGAERAIFWTRKMLESGDRAGSEERWEFLGELPRVHREPGLMFVHGSARNPLNEYVFPEDIYNQRKMERIFSLVERYCFQGHTHIPGVFTDPRDAGLWAFSYPRHLDWIARQEYGCRDIVGPGHGHHHVSLSQVRIGDDLG